MYGSRRRISGHNLRRTQRTHSRTQRARESPSSHPREHVREHVIHSRRASRRRPWGATGLWRAVQGVRPSAMARVSAPYRRTVPARSSSRVILGTSTERIQRQDTGGAVNEVITFSYGITRNHERQKIRQHRRSFCYLLAIVHVCLFFSVYL